MKRRLWIIPVLAAIPFIVTTSPSTLTFAPRLEATAKKVMCCRLISTVSLAAKRLRSRKKPPRASSNVEPI